MENKIKKTWTNQLARRGGLQEKHLIPTGEPEVFITHPYIVDVFHSFHKPYGYQLYLLDTISGWYNTSYNE